MNKEEAIESFKHSNEQAKVRLEVEKMRMDNDEIKELEFYIERDEIAIKALEQMPKILETLDFAIDASNGETNYFVGFRNGLRYSKLLIDGEEPQFEHCTEQEPKTGHWISHHHGCEYECSECHDKQKVKSKYCPDCGCRMIEPQESEGK